LYAFVDKQTGSIKYAVFPYKTTLTLCFIILSMGEGRGRDHILEINKINQSLFYNTQSV